MAGSRESIASSDGSLDLIRIAKNCSILSPNQAHLLPCSISFNGPVPVLDYFRPKSADSIIEGVQMKEVAFRGRKLLGRTTQLPDDYCGIFLEKEGPIAMEGGGSSIKRAAEARRRKSDKSAMMDAWNAKARFGDLTYWRHDDNPHSVDSGHKFLDWLRLACMMHKPVSADEVLIERSKMKKSGQKRKQEQM